MAVNQFKEKIPIFEAAKWSADNEEIVEISEWLGQNQWPLLTEEQMAMDPASNRPQGHFINEDGTLRIQWPEDQTDIPVGHWVVMGRRYHDITPWDDEAFNFTYDQYGS